MHAPLCCCCARKRLQDVHKNIHARRPRNKPPTCTTFLCVWLHRSHSVLGNCYHVLNISGVVFCFLKSLILLMFSLETPSKHPSSSQRSNLSAQLCFPARPGGSEGVPTSRWMRNLSEVVGISGDSIKTCLLQTPRSQLTGAGALRRDTMVFSCTNLILIDICCYSGSAERCAASSLA